MGEESDRRREARDAQLLSPRQERELREEVRKRLEAQESERTVPSRRQTPARVSKEQIERRRIIREAEDEFFAERGLYRYRNHRGEIEWLSGDDIEHRKSRRHRRGQRSLKSRMKRLFNERSISDLVSGIVVIAVFTAAGFLVFRQASVIATPKYPVEVRSIPPGAAIFIDRMPADASTNTQVFVSEAGHYAISVYLPGYRVVPDHHVVEVGHSEVTPSVAFTLYATSSDSIESGPGISSGEDGSN